MRHPCATIADALEALKLATEQELAEDAKKWTTTIGWVDAKRDTVERLQMWINHLRLVATQRFPWCDTCKLPAVSNEWSGKCHSTPGDRFGLDPELDKSGHEVTMREWYDVSPSGLTS